MSRSSITSEETSEYDGARQIQHQNAAAGQAVGEIVKSTLGPNGRDKMIVSDIGEVTITDDGSTVLEELELDNPFADLVATVGLAQQAEVGDGATTAVTVATELLVSVEMLFDRGVHPTKIIDGFREADTIAQESIEDLTHTLDSQDEQFLQRAIASRLTGVVSGEDQAALSEVIATAATNIVAEASTEPLDRFAVESRPGKQIGEFELIPGAIVEKSPMRPSMPTDFEDATILLVDTPLEVDDVEYDTEAKVKSSEKYDEYLEREKQAQQEIVDWILESGADAVFCQKRVNDRIANLLSEEGVLVTDFTVKPDLEFMARLLGIKITGDLSNVSDAHLGHASVRHEDEKKSFYVEVSDGRAKTLLVHGSTTSVARKLENEVTEAVALAIQLASDGRLVAGAGATEMELARRIRDEAPTNDSREQLAMEAFADALEEVPRILATNAGHDPVVTIASLRAAHADGNTSAGVDVLQGETVDALDAGIVDIPGTKSEAITSATEAANIVANVDDVVPAKDL